MDEHWYLAGPFFNPEQLRVATWIADLVAARGISNYAPVRNRFQGGIHEKEKAEAVFRENVSQLRSATLLLAHIDWLMPEGQMVRCVKSFARDQLTSTLEMGLPLNLPDSGTVWEMGYAIGMNHANRARTPGHPWCKVVAYTLREDKKLNLMLARSCDGYLRGEAALVKFVQTKGKEGFMRCYDGEDV